MQYKIIIEGCDGTGKTTLAKKLIRKYGIRSYVHINKDDANDYLFYLASLGKTDVIYDRHFIGEMIYPKVFGREGNLQYSDFARLLYAAREAGYKIIILHSRFDVLKSRIKIDEHSEVANQLEEINEQFFEIGKKWKIPMFDTSKCLFDEICEVIESE